MEAFLQTLGIYIWKVVEDGYIVPKSPPIDGFGKNILNAMQNIEMQLCVV